MIFPVEHKHPSCITTVHFSIITAHSTFFSPSLTYRIQKVCWHAHSLPHSLSIKPADSEVPELQMERVWQGKFWTTAFVVVFLIMTTLSWFCVQVENRTAHTTCHFFSLTVVKYVNDIYLVEDGFIQTRDPCLLWLICCENKEEGEEWNRFSAEPSIV